MPWPFGRDRDIQHVQQDIGNVEYDVFIRYRKLRPLRWVPIPNVPSIGHWMLEVGDSFVEIAEPKGSNYARAFFERVREEIKRRGEGQLQNILSDVKDEFERDEELEPDETETKLRDRVLRLVYSSGTGRGVKIPLSFSTANGKRTGRKWRKYNKDCMRIKVGTTRLTPEATLKCAQYIHKAVFETGYDLWYLNCQAFVCYLVATIWTLAPPYCRLPIIFDKDLAWEYRNILASYLSYKIWRVVRSIQFPPDPQIVSRQWKLKLGNLDYKEMTPPALMREMVEPGEPQDLYHRILDQQPNLLPSHMPQPHRGTHAAHALNQMHHSFKHRQEDAVSAAVLIQQQIILQQVIVQQHDTHPHTAQHQGDQQQLVIQQAIQQQSDQQQAATMLSQMSTNPTFTMPPPPGMY